VAVAGRGVGAREGDGAVAGTAGSMANAGARVADAGRDAFFTGGREDPDDEEESEDEEDELASSGLICSYFLLYFPFLALLRA
jgi:hypothetical protein